MTSIIIPVFNGKDHINNCVQAILSQSCSDFEILLIDDGSNDGSAEICDNLSNRNSKIRAIHQQNSGVSVARNTGIKEARGEWLMFVDVDDELAPYALECLLSITGDDVDAVCGGIVSGKSFGKLLHNRENQRIEKINETSLILSKVLIDPTRYLTCHSWLLKTSLLIDNEINFNDELTMGEDGEMILRYLQLCSHVAFTECVVYRYSINQNSTIHKWKHGVTEKYIKTINKVYENIKSDNESVAAYTLIHLLLILTHDTFHVHNGLSFNSQIKECKELLQHQIFSDAFNIADLSKFGLAKKFTLFCLKHNLVLPAWLAVRVRQMQNSMHAS